MYSHTEAGRTGIGLELGLIWIAVEDCKGLIE